MALWNGFATPEPDDAPPTQPDPVPVAPVYSASPAPVSFSGIVKGVPRRRAGDLPPPVPVEPVTSAPVAPGPNPFEALRPAVLPVEAAPIRVAPVATQPSPLAIPGLDPDDGSAATLQAMVNGPAIPGIVAPAAGSPVPASPVAAPPPADDMSGAGMAGSPLPPPVPSPTDLPDETLAVPSPNSAPVPPQGQPPAAEGFWKTAGRAFASNIAPAVGTAVGGLAAGALAIESGPGAIAADIAGGALAGTATRKLQNVVLGEEASKANDAQMEANAQAHPIAAQIGTLAPFLISLLGGGGGVAKDAAGKVITGAKGAAIRGITAEGKQAIQDAAAAGTQYLAPRVERIAQTAAQGARAGASEGAQEKYVEGKDVSVLDSAAKGALTFGATGAFAPAAAVTAVGLFPVAKAILTEAVGRGVKDGAAMTLAGDLYDSAVHGKSFSLEDTAKEMGGSIPTFVLQNALMGFFHHGLPAKAASPEAIAAEHHTPADELSVIDKRLAQIEGSRTGGHEEERETLTAQRAELEKSVGGTKPGEATTIPGVSPETAAPPVPAAAGQDDPALAAMVQTRDGFQMLLDQGKVAPEAREHTQAQVDSLSRHIEAAQGKQSTPPAPAPGAPAPKAPAVPPPAPEAALATAGDTSPAPLAADTPTGEEAASSRTERTTKPDEQNTPPSFERETADQAAPPGTTPAPDQPPTGRVSDGNPPPELATRDGEEAAPVVGHIGSDAAGAARRRDAAGVAEADRPRDKYDSDPESEEHVALASAVNSEAASDHPEGRPSASFSVLRRLKTRGVEITPDFARTVHEQVQEILEDSGIGDEEKQAQLKALVRQHTPVADFAAPAAPTTGEAEGTAAPQHSSAVKPTPNAERQPVTPEGQRAANGIAEIEARRKAGNGFISAGDVQSLQTHRENLERDLNEQVLGKYPDPVTENGKASARAVKKFEEDQRAGAQLDPGQHAAWKNHRAVLHRDFTQQRQAFDAQPPTDASPTPARPRIVAPAESGGDAPGIAAAREWLANQHVEGKHPSAYQMSSALKMPLPTARQLIMDHNDAVNRAAVEQKHGAASKSEPRSPAPVPAPTPEVPSKPSVAPTFKRPSKAAVAAQAKVVRGLEKAAQADPASKRAAETHRTEAAKFAEMQRQRAMPLQEGETPRSFKMPAAPDGNEDVLGVDPHTLDVELEDHSKYGVQKVADGQALYVEKVTPADGSGDSLGAARPDTQTDSLFGDEDEPFALRGLPGSAFERAAAARRVESALVASNEGTKPDVPTLRPGEKGTGDLFQGEDQPFNLVGETGVDHAARQAEQERQERESAEAKAKEDREQQPLFSPLPAEGPISSEQAETAARQQVEARTEQLAKLGVRQTEYGPTSAASGLEIGSDGTMRIDPAKLARSLAVIRDNHAKGTEGTPHEWFEQALHHESFHGVGDQVAVEQGFVTPEGHADRPSFYDSLPDKDLPGDFDEKGRASYGPEWDNLPRWARKAEFVRMLLEGKYTGQLTEGLYKFIRPIVEYFKRLAAGEGASKGLKDFVRPMEARIEAARPARVSHYNPNDRPNVAAAREWLADRRREGARPTSAELVQRRAYAKRPVRVEEARAILADQQRAEEMHALTVAEGTGRGVVDSLGAAAPEPILPSDEEGTTARKEMVPASMAERARNKSAQVKAAVARALGLDAASDTIKKHFDAIDTRAGRTGVQEGNSVRLDMRHDADDDRAALAAVEAGGSRAALERDLAKVQASPDPELAAEFAPVYQRALDRLDDLNAATKNHGRIMADQASQAQRAGLERVPWEPYVKQVLDDPQLGKTIVSQHGLNINEDHATNADALAAGVRPRIASLSDATQHYVQRNQRAVNEAAFHAELADMKARDGKPVLSSIEESTAKKTAAGNIASSSKVPRGYDTVQAGNKVLTVHKDLSPVVKALYGDSLIRQNAIGGALLDFAALVKHGTVGVLDTFHGSRVATLGALGYQTAGWDRGLAALKYSPENADRAVKAGKLTRAQADYVKANGEAVERGLRQGLNVGRFSDNLLEAARQHGLVERIPVVGKASAAVTDYTFRHVQRGVMTQAYVVAEARNRARFPELDIDEVARRSATEVNEFFGNLGNQGFLTSKTMQDAAKLVLMAPGFAEGKLRTEGRAYAQAANAGVDALRGKGFRVGGTAQAIGSVVLASIIGNQMLNLFTRGKPTWENEEDGHRWDAWIPGGPHGRGFFYSPLSIAAEYSHALLKYTDHGESAFDAAAHVVSNKLSGPARAVKDLAGGTDWRGQPFATTGERVKAAAADALPLPIPAGPFVEKDPKSPVGYSLNHERGAVEKQLLAMAGVKVDNAPSARGQMFDIAQKFKPAGNEAVPAQTRAASPYGELRHALDNEDEGQAAGEITRLVTEGGKTLEKIGGALGIGKDGKVAPELFTGKADAEARMIAQLTPEQRKLWVKAQNERRANAALFAKVVSGMTPEQRRTLALASVANRRGNKGLASTLGRKTPADQG